MTIASSEELKPPAFSVVIPLFNKGPHIQRAIASAQAQTYPARQIIVVDDGSTDGGFEWLEANRSADLVLLRRSEPGPGGYAARNLGIEKANCEWIAFLDADDEWQPTHLEKVAAALASLDDPSDVVCVFSGYEDVYADGRRSADPFSAKVGGPIVELGFADLLEHWIRLNASPVWTSATVCRRSALIDAGKFPEARCRRGGDKDTWLRVAHLGTTLYTGAITARYFRDTVNMTTKKAYSNTVPCIVASIKQLRASEPGRVGVCLGTLQNIEILNYALVSARSAGLQRSAWADYDSKADPRGGMILRFLSSPVGSVVARLAHTSRRLLRR